MIKTRRADAIVCAVGALIAIPTFFFGIRFIVDNMTITWVSFSKTKKLILGIDVHVYHRLVL